jgi:mannitol/fructose-specific phosphotransferase system IIA component
MREVFFAIIIDTFGQLTDRQNKRDLYANNACFICGIYRHDYEQLQALTKSTGFVEHREVAHNIAHYLYFVMR